jgi:uncharacterized protein HemY
MKTIYYIAGTLFALTGSGLLAFKYGVHAVATSKSSPWQRQRMLQRYRERVAAQQQTQAPLLEAMHAGDVEAVNARWASLGLLQNNAGLRRKLTSFYLKSGHPEKAKEHLHWLLMEGKSGYQWDGQTLLDYLKVSEPSERLEVVEHWFNQVKKYAIPEASTVEGMTPEGAAEFLVAQGLAGNPKTLEESNRHYLRAARLSPGSFIIMQDAVGAARDFGDTETAKRYAIRASKLTDDPNRKAGVLAMVGIYKPEAETNVNRRP